MNYKNKIERSDLPSLVSKMKSHYKEFGAPESVLQVEGDVLHLFQGVYADHERDEKQETLRSELYFSVVDVFARYI